MFDRFDTIPVCDGRTDRNDVANTARSIVMYIRWTAYSSDVNINSASHEEYWTYSYNYSQKYSEITSRMHTRHKNNNNNKVFYGTFPGTDGWTDNHSPTNTDTNWPSSRTLKTVLSCLQLCSNRRHRQDKTVLSCPCRRCEHNLTVQLFPRCSIPHVLQCTHAKIANMTRVKLVRWIHPQRSINQSMNQYKQYWQYVS